MQIGDAFSNWQLRDYRPRRAAATDGGCEATDNRPSPCIAARGAIEQVLDRRELWIVLATDLVERGDDAGRADLVLQSPMQPVPGIERVPDERQIADLAGGAMRAADELVV